MKELKFIHITKTAGTSIEDIGIANNIRWGRFHKEYGWWHGFFINKPKWLKEKYDWFTVVRNPYTRIVSEFYCPWVHNGHRNTSDIKIFNRTIQNFITKRSKSGDHWSEQYKYIDHNYSIHILKFEELSSDFSNLMKTYNLDRIQLNQYNNKSIKQFNINHLSRDTLDLINRIYDQDFISFNYVKI